MFWKSVKHFLIATWSSGEEKINSHKRVSCLIAVRHPHTNSLIIIAQSDARQMNECITRCTRLRFCALDKPKEHFSCEWNVWRAGSYFFLLLVLLRFRWRRICLFSQHRTCVCTVHRNFHLTSKPGEKCSKINYRRWSPSPSKPKTESGNRNNKYTQTTCVCNISDNINSFLFIKSKENRHGNFHLRKNLFLFIFRHLCRRRAREKSWSDQFFKSLDFWPSSVKVKFLKKLKDAVFVSWN